MLPVRGEHRRFPVSASMIAEFEQAYPGLDVRAELRKMQIKLKNVPVMCRPRPKVVPQIMAWLDKAAQQPPAQSAAKNRSAPDGPAVDAQGRPTRDLFGQPLEPGKYDQWMKDAEERGRGSYVPPEQRRQS